MPTGMMDRELKVSLHRIRSFCHLESAQALINQQGEGKVQIGDAPTETS